MTNLMNEIEYLYPEVLETLEIKCEIFLCYLLQQLEVKEQGVRFEVAGSQCLVIM